MFITKTAHEEIIHAKNDTIAEQTKFIEYLRNHISTLEIKLEDALKKVDMSDIAAAAPPPITELSLEGQIVQLDKDIAMVKNAPVFTMKERETKRREVERLGNLLREKQDRHLRENVTVAQPQ